MGLVSRMTTKSIPDGFDSLIPSLVVSDGNAAIEFYKKVFGAVELMRMNMPGSTKIGHAELKIRGHVLMLNDACPEMGIQAPSPNASQPPYGVFIYVNNTDELYNKALQNGARALMPPADMFWGDRFAKFIDPFGHCWAIATHIRDVSPEECAKAMEEWGKQQAAAAQA